MGTFKHNMVLLIIVIAMKTRPPEKLVIDDKRNSGKMVYDSNWTNWDVMWFEEWPIVTARKRSLGQVNVFTGIIPSVHRGRGLSVRGVSLTETPPPWIEPPPWTETSLTVKSRRYASYWNAFLFKPYINSHEYTALLRYTLWDELINAHYDFLTKFF